MSDDKDNTNSNEESSNTAYTQAVPSATDCLSGIDWTDPYYSGASGLGPGAGLTAGAAGVGQIPSITGISYTPLTGGSSSYGSSSAGGYTLTFSNTTASSSSLGASMSNSPYSLPNSSPWGWSTGQSAVHIKEGDLVIDEGGDVKIGNQSLKAFMKAMSDRLAILQPNPAKLEKFEALKQAYEHYKLLEELCYEEDKKDNK